MNTTIKDVSQSLHDISNSLKSMLDIMINQSALDDVKPSSVKWSSTSVTSRRTFIDKVITSYSLTRIFKDVDLDKLTTLSLDISSLLSSHDSVLVVISDYLVIALVLIVADCLVAQHFNYMGASSKESIATLIDSYLKHIAQSSEVLYGRI